MIDQSVLRDVSAEHLAQLIEGNQDEHFTRSLRALKFADEVYRCLPGSEMALRATQRLLGELCFSQALYDHLEPTEAPTQAPEPMSDPVPEPAHIALPYPKKKYTLATKNNVQRQIGNERGIRLVQQEWLERTLPGPYPDGFVEARVLALASTLPHRSPAGGNFLPMRDGMRDGIRHQIRTVQERLKSHPFPLTPVFARNISAAGLSRAGWSNSMLLEYNSIAEWRNAMALKDLRRRRANLHRSKFHPSDERLCLAFSCLAYLQTGEFDIEAQSFTNAIAIAYEDSIFVAEKLLIDPCDAIENDSVRRIIGNIGKSGLAVLVPRKYIRCYAMLDTRTNDEIAPEPIMRKDELKLVHYCPFDGHLIDTFASTSLHLKFTGSETPISTASLGEVQPESMMLETLIQVYDRGNWIADIDVLSALKSVPSVFVRWPSLLLDFEQRRQYETLVSIDSWDELLDTPPGNAIVRASGNYLARIATCESPYIPFYLKSTICLSTLLHYLGQFKAAEAAPADSLSLN